MIVGIDKGLFEHARQLQREFPTLRASEIYRMMLDRKAAPGISEAELVAAMREVCRFAHERGLSIPQADDVFASYFVQEQERRRR